MKYIVAFLIALFGAVAFAAQTVDPGYKSSELGIEDGDTDYFIIPIEGRNGDFCNPYSNPGITCVVEIIYDKHTAGEQDVCIGTTQLNSCDDTSADYVEHIGLDSRTKTYYYEYEGGMGVDINVYISITGTCETSTSSTPCLSTTDVDIESVRIFEASGTNGGDVTDGSGYTNIAYVPFLQDLDGSNTALYTVDVADVDDFAYPSMVFDVGSGGDYHYIVLDIDESLADTLYAVEFHYVYEAVCGDSSYSNASDVCWWDVANYDNWVVPNGEDNWDSPQTGDYVAGPTNVTEGMWSVTPYVYGENVESSLDFRYCGGLGYECASASGLAPSIALFAILFALIALLF